GEPISHYPIRKEIRTATVKESARGAGSFTVAVLIRNPDLATALRSEKKSFCPSAHCAKVCVTRGARHIRYRGGMRMKASTRSWLLWLLLALLSVGTGLADENEGTPCDFIYVFVSPEGGPTYVFNFTDQPITFHLQTVQSICSSAQC